MKNLKKLWILVFILLLLGGLTLLVGRLIPKDDQALPVLTKTLKGEYIEKAISVIGIVIPMDETLVRSPLSEVITSIYLEEGDMVVEGQLLFSLGERDLTLSMKETYLQVLQVKKELEDLKESMDSRQKEEDLRLLRELTNIERAEEALERLKVEKEREILRFHRQIYSLERELRRTEDSFAEAKTLYKAQAISQKELNQLQDKVYDLQQDLLDLKEERALYLEVVFPQQMRASSLDLRSAQESLAEVTFNLHRGRVKEADIQIQQARLEQLQERLKNLEDDLERTQIYSPMAGQIISLLVTEGDLVSRSQPLLQIFTGEGFLVEASLDEMDMGSIRRGQKVRITSEAYPKEMALGLVHWIAPRAKQQGNIALFQIEIAVYEGEEFLRLGMFVDLEIITATGEDVLVVPVQSLRQVDSYRGVFVVEDGQARLKDVITGIETLSQVEILGGLTEGDQVITGSFAILQQLQDGVEVKPLERETHHAH